MKYKLPKLLTVFFGIFFLSVGVVFAATRVTVDPAELTVLEGEEFEVNLGFDTRGDEVFGSSVTILYPWKDVELVDATNGDFFSEFEYGHDNNIGRLELHGFFDSAENSKNGTGRLAKLKFKSNTKDGSGRVSVICRGDEFTRIINKNGESVQDCLQMGHINLYYSYDTTATPPPVATPTPRPTPVANKGGEPDVIVVDVEENPNEEAGASGEPVASDEPEATFAEPVEATTPLSVGGYQLDQILLLVAIGAGVLGLLFILIHLVGKLFKKKEPPTNQPPQQPLAQQQAQQVQKTAPPAPTTPQPPSDALPQQ